MRISLFLIVGLLISAGTVMGLTLEEKIEMARQQELQRKAQAQQAYEQKRVQEQKKIAERRMQTQRQRPQRQTEADATGASVAAPPPPPSEPPVEAVTVSASSPAMKIDFAVDQIWIGEYLCSGGSTSVSLYLTSLKDNEVEAVCRLESPRYGTNTYFLRGNSTTEGFVLKPDGRVLGKSNNRLHKIGIEGAFAGDGISATLIGSRCKPLSAKLRSDAEALSVAGELKGLADKYYAEAEAEKQRRITQEEAEKQRMIAREEEEKVRLGQLENSRAVAAPIEDLPLFSTMRPEMEKALKKQFGKPIQVDDKKNLAWYDAEGFIAGIEQVVVAYTSHGKVAYMSYIRFNGHELNDLLNALKLKYGEATPGSPGKGGILAYWQCKDNVIVAAAVDSSGDQAERLGEAMFERADAEIYRLNYFTPHNSQYQKEAAAQKKRDATARAKVIGGGL